MGVLNPKVIIDDSITEDKLSEDLKNKIDGAVSTETDPIFYEWKSGTSIAAGLNSSVGTNSVGIGANSVATYNNSVALGNDSETSDPNTVSVGNSIVVRRITNMAQGKNPADAVTLLQLNNAIDLVADRYLPTSGGTLTGTLYSQDIIQGKSGSSIGLIGNAFRNAYVDNTTTTNVIPFSDGTGNVGASNLRFDSGYFGKVYTGNKTSYYDGNPGVILQADGGINIQHNSTPYLDFYVGASTRRNFRLIANENGLAFEGTNFIPLYGNNCNIGSETHNWNSGFFNNLYATNLSSAKINGVYLSSTGDGNSFLVNDGTYKEINKIQTLAKSNSERPTDLNALFTFGDRSLRYDISTTGTANIPTTTGIFTTYTNNWDSGNYATQLATDVFTGNTYSRAYNNGVWLDWQRLGVNTNETDPVFTAWRDATSLEAGNKRISNVATGTSDTDAVNLGQLNSAIESVAGNSGQSSVIYIYDLDSLILYEPISDEQLIIALDKILSNSISKIDSQVIRRGGDNESGIFLEFKVNQSVFYSSTLDQAQIRINSLTNLMGSWEVSLFSFLRENGIWVMDEKSSSNIG